MMKKKGSAIILSLSIIAILSILTAALLSQASSAYIVTLKNEKRDKITLLAESGIEKGISALKQKIHDTPSIFDEININFAPENFTFTEENIRVTVSFRYVSNYSDIKVTNEPAVEITSEAINSTLNNRKKMVATILKKDVSNEYYEFLFSNVISTLDSTEGPDRVSFTMQEQLNPFILEGSMYLQGKTINIKPKSFTHETGRININAKKVETINNDNLVNAMYVNNSSTVSPSAVKSKVKELSPNLLPILGVKYNVTGENIELKDFYSGTGYSNPNSSYSVKAAQVKTIENNNEVTTLVTFKITKKIGQPDQEFNWSSFVTDVKDYIMRNMIKINGRYFIGTPNGSNYGNAFEKAYEGMYKLYIIDGNVGISTPSNTSGYINHVIYSTGKVTFKSGGNNFIKFTNSSIMASQIEVKDLRSSFGGYLELRGIKKVGEEAYNGSLSPFSRGNRAAINKFCMKHLNGYADSLRFKIHKWVED